MFAARELDAFTRELQTVAHERISVKRREMYSHCFMLHNILNAKFRTIRKLNKRLASRLRLFDDSLGNVRLAIS